MTWYIADGVFTKKPRPGATVFRANPADGDIILPEGVVSIARDAFLDVPGVKRVVVPEGCRYIDEHAFHACDTLESIVLPDTLRSIGKCAFWGCYRLESIHIPDGVTVTTYAAEEGAATQCSVYSYTCAISETQAIQVELAEQNGVWTVLRWQAVSTTEWEADDSVDIWDGDGIF